MPKKKGCIKPVYLVLLVAVVLFVVFKYYAFLPGRHYEDGHFLALVNDEDVRVLHSLGYGLDDNKEQLFSKDGLPMFAQGSGSHGYIPFDATDILLQLKRDVENNKNTPTSTPVLQTSTSELPTETPSEAPSEDMDETEGSFSAPGEFGVL